LSRQSGRFFVFLVLTIALVPPAHSEPGTGEALGPPKRKAPTIKVRHRDDLVDGWSVAESAHVRVYHQGSRDRAEKAALTAEDAWSGATRKWLAESPDDEVYCAVYLYPTATAYAEATGLPAATPGVTTVRGEEGHVFSRRIDLNGEAPNLLTAVLPHEVTHAVLAGQLGSMPVPPWANEGIAVLAEPRPFVERHLRDLPGFRRDGRLFVAAELMKLKEYPARRLMGPFYAQSVSLVEFLTREKGAQTFTSFLREAARTGWEAALKKKYGWDFDELDRRWRESAFANGE
jgi:hypothetical protein